MSAIFAELKVEVNPKLFLYVLTLGANFPMYRTLSKRVLLRVERLKLRFIQLILETNVPCIKE